MTGIENNGISFGRKLGNFKFQNFNGIDKQGFSDKIDAQLRDAFFAKYDKDKNGILDRKELFDMQNAIKEYSGKNKQLGKHEASKFIQENLGLDKDSKFNREDIHAFLSEIQADTDTIADVENKEHYTLVKYKPESDGSVKTSAYTKGDNGSASYCYLEDINYPDNSCISTGYDKNGQIKSRTREKGSVYEWLDHENGDRVMCRSTEKGSGGTEVIMYDYDESSGKQTETMYLADGLKENVLSYIDNHGIKPYKQVVKSGGQVVSSTEYTYDKDGNTTRVTTEGQAKTTTITDKDGNEKPYEHTVQQGDTWYGIVAAKYGLDEKKDYKTIMNIVHQLKRNMGVDFKSTTIPEKISLPSTVKVNGEEIKLADINAKVNQEHYKTNAGGIKPAAKEVKQEANEVQTAETKAPVETTEEVLDTGEVYYDIDDVKSMLSGKFSSSKTEDDSLKTPLNTEAVENKAVPETKSENKKVFDINTYDYGYALESYFRVKKGMDSENVQSFIDAFERGESVTHLTSNTSEEYSFSPENNTITCVFKMDGKEGATKRVYNLKTGEFKVLDGES